jgi:hypothetical protein
MALPDNAVDNAVAKLDGIADELLKSSASRGWPSPSCTAERRSAKGFGVKDATKPADDPNNRVGPDTVFQLASLSKRSAPP